VLLAVAFRSILVPLKAVVVFLSLGASLRPRGPRVPGGGLRRGARLLRRRHDHVWTLGIIITIALGLGTDYPRRAAHDHGARHDGSRRDVPPAAGRAGAGRRSGATPAVPDHAA